MTGTEASAGGDVGRTGVHRPGGEDDWTPVTPSRWRFRCGEVILAEPGVSRPGPRRPFEYAVVTSGPRWSAVRIEAEVRLDTPVQQSDRDVIVVFGWRSDTEFYYAHLCSDNTIYPHNGIFKVDNADRERVDHQWHGRSGRPAPAVVDADWHRVRVEHRPVTGEIAVYVDGGGDPLMTATDTTFACGRVGFGSFDNTGRLRRMTVTGTPA